MENIQEDKTATSLKVWKQSQQRLRLLAALKNKTMQQVLDEILIRALQDYQHEHTSI